MIKADKSTKVQRELIPNGTHVARCYSMVHIGTVQWEYLGEIKHTNKVRLTFELPHELRVFNSDKGEQPIVISKEYTLSMHEKANLRKDVEAWRGKRFTEQEADDFDITKLLGRACMLNIIDQEAKNGNIYNNIAGISPLMKGMECPAQYNESFEFNYQDSFDSAWVENQPEFIKDMIKGTPEYQDRITQLNDAELDKEMNAKIDNDDLPF